MWLAQAERREGGEETLGCVWEIGSDCFSGWESLRTRPEDCLATSLSEVWPGGFRAAGGSAGAPGAGAPLQVLA